MASYIPFLTSGEGLNAVSSIFVEPHAVRCDIARAETLRMCSKSGLRIWIDHCVDGFDDVVPRGPDLEKNRAATPWYEMMGECPHFKEIGSPTFQAKPTEPEVRAFVKCVLDRCKAFDPAFITVPQLPHVQKAERNKINRFMAAASAKWKTDTKFSGRLILPIIITKASQIEKKFDRNSRVDHISKCYADSDATGIWVVDSNLRDETQTAATRKSRFLPIIDFHNEIDAKLSSKLRIGGPYWGLNLVLWAKNLIDCPAIGLGSGYGYFISGMKPKMAAVKIAIPCLRRRVLHEHILPWLDKAIAKLGSSHPAHPELVKLQHDHQFLADGKRAKLQVNHFYKSWFDKFSSLPKDGRAMALYQDLSAAYALGKILPDLPSEEGPTRPAESIVEPLMMTCL